ncbi:MAG: hypothetical protein CME87_08845 [Herbaspirillum sp.]|nr:hypothetical protein [Herbaspirillum sp.]
MVLFGQFSNLLGDFFFQVVFRNKQRTRPYRFCIQRHPISGQCIGYNQINMVSLAEVMCKIFDFLSIQQERVQRLNTFQLIEQRNSQLFSFATSILFAPLLCALDGGGRGHDSPLARAASMSKACGWPSVTSSSRTASIRFVLASK